MLVGFKRAITFKSKNENVFFIIPENKEKILTPLDDLIKYFNKAHELKTKEEDRLKDEINDAKKAGDAKNEKELKIKLKEKGLSDYLDSYDIHEAGQRLWQELMSAALKDIDRRPKGNSALFEYVDAATKFEDMLYGLESYYRDHTLHSLWVYLIGILLMGRDGQQSSESMNNGKSKSEDEGKKCDGDNLNWYLYNCTGSA